MTAPAAILSELGQAALAYAERGWYVFPLAPGSKVPLISKRMGGNGHKDATTDPEQIRRWWTATPNANIGLNCAASGLVALLRKGRESRTSPFPRRTYPTGSVTGMPSAV